MAVLPTCVQRCCNQAVTLDKELICGVWESFSIHFWWAVQNLFSNYYMSWLLPVSTPLVRICGCTVGGDISGCVHAIGEDISGCMHTVGEDMWMHCCGLGCHHSVSRGCGWGWDWRGPVTTSNLHIINESLWS